MPKAKLTMRFVESIPFLEKGQAIYSDTELAGFGLIVGKQSKTYFAQRDIKGKTVRVTIGKHGVFTLEQARTDAKELLVRIARGENPNQTKHEKALNAITLKQAMDAYEKGRKSMSESSLYKLKCCSSKWLSDWMNLPLSKITKDMVLKRLAEIGKDRGGATANQAMWMFRSVYNYALLTNESLPPNPIRVISQSKGWYAQERRTSVIKPTQLKPWYEAVMLIDNSVIRDYLCLLLFTGMRRKEGLTLLWADVDFQEKIITVQETKSGKPLVIPMSGYVQELLKSRRKRTGESEWVFPSRGATGHLVEPKKTVADVAKKSGVNFMLHDLRRTFITIAESLDISSYALKQLLNHSQSNDVTAGYIIMNVDRLREPMNRIAAYILEKIQSNVGNNSQQTDAA